MALRHFIRSLDAEDAPARILAAWDVAPGCRLDLSRYAGAAARYGPHHHASLDVSLVVRGRIEEQVGRSKTIGTSSFTSVKPAGLEHSDSFEGVVEILRLRIDLEEVAASARPRAAPAPRGWLRRPELGLSLFRLAREVQASATPEKIEEAVGDLVGLVGIREKQGATPPAWMGRFEELIGDRLSEPLTIRELAEEIGLHPVSVARAVRRVHGCSARQLIIRRRVSRAIELLRRSSLGIAEIAAETGFSDQAHLTRLLRGQSAFTPASLRRLGR